MNESRPFQTVGPAAGTDTGTDDIQVNSTHDATSRGITRCNHRGPALITNKNVITTTLGVPATPSTKETSPTDSESQSSPSLQSHALLAHVPRHPYPDLFAYHWYRDLVYVLVCQVLMIGCFILWVQGAIVSILGISYILRSRLFLIWIFGLLPLSCLVHLAAWYLAGCIVTKVDCAEKWWSEIVRHDRMAGEEKSWWRSLTRGRCLYYSLVFVLKAGLLTATFLGSAALAGPQTVNMGDGQM